MIPMTTNLQVRHLRTEDIPQLLVLEARQWNASQRADAHSMRQRIACYPELCAGVFCLTTGQAVASVFAKPISKSVMNHVSNWDECAALPADTPGHSGVDAEAQADSLFGISLTSVHPRSAEAMIALILPYALKQGWRYVFLGSPMPGLRAALGKQPELQACDYAHGRSKGVPIDPQLRYYHRMGFTKVVSVLPGYFPHERSLDYGAIIRADVPLSQLNWLWRFLPLAWLRAMVPALVSCIGAYEHLSRGLPSRPQSA
jgi:hypothetical protein